MSKTVKDIPDTELIRRAMNSIAVTPRTTRARMVPLWAKVMGHFGLGSTYAWQLCQEYGFNPDQEVRP